MPEPGEFEARLNPEERRGAKACVRQRAWISRSVTPLGQRPKRNTQRLGTLSKGVRHEADLLIPFRSLPSSGCRSGEFLCRKGPPPARARNARSRPPLVGGGG